MTGPPTPPVTSPVELQDQARADAAAEQAQAQAQAEAQATEVAPAASAGVSNAAPPPTSDNRPEIYRNAMASIIEAIKKVDYVALVQLAEDLDFTTASDRQPSRLLVVAPLILGYLVLDDTSAAKYASLRLSDNLLNVSLSRALQSLIVATTNREHAKVYDQANNLLKVVNQDFPDKDFGTIIESLLSTFVETFRRRTFQLLSKAYTSLPLQLACVYLGWPEAEVLKVAEKHGWSYDASSKVLSPGAQPPAPKTTPSSFSSLDTFHFVADSVARIEV